jgi:hypothetical protein
MRHFLALGLLLTVACNKKQPSNSAEEAATPAAEEAAEEVAAPAAEEAAAE